MAQPARLITPRGKTIELSPEIYREIKTLVDARSRRWRKAEVDGLIREFYGKYAGGDSLTEALLKEHAEERAREEAKIVLLYG